MGNLSDGVYALLNEIMLEAGKDCLIEALRHEVRKANKGLRHLRGQANKFNREANLYFEKYWDLRRDIGITFAERQYYNEIVRYLAQKHEIQYANFLVKLQQRFDNISNGR